MKITNADGADGIIYHFTTSGVLPSSNAARLWLFTGRQQGFCMEICFLRVFTDYTMSVFCPFLPPVSAVATKLVFDGAAV